MFNINAALLNRIWASLLRQGCMLTKESFGPLAVAIAPLYDGIAEKKQKFG